MSIKWDVGYVIRKRAQLTPEKTAVIFEDEPWTYRRINEGANRCARMMQKKGLKKGDRVAALLNNCMEFLEAYFAAAKLGLVFAPLNWRMTGSEIEFQINDCGARMFLFHDAFLKTADQIRGGLKAEDDKFIFLKSRKSKIDCPEWAEDYHTLADGEAADEPEIRAPVYLEDPLAIVYTSGTTGNPKGAVLSHEQTYFKNIQIGMYTGGTPEDVVIAQMPLFHSGGLFIVATPALAGGMTIIMRSGFNPMEFAKDIEKYKGTVVFALTTMWKMIIATKMLDKIDVSSVRVVAGGGERTPVSLFEELAKRGLYMQQGFGQTENSAMMMLPKDDIFRKMGSVGKPGFSTDIWIEDKSGTRLAPGEVGEIVASGPTVMSGYWNRPEDTARAIVDGVLHTGDLGYVDEEGYFYVVDREKDMYRSGGENVYPAEVEKILVEHPEINNAAIIGVPDDRWGETGVAFVVPERKAEVTLEKIHEFLKEKAAKFKWPTRLEIVKELPMTSTMKVKKAELKVRYAEEQRASA